MPRSAGAAAVEPAVDQSRHIVHSGTTGLSVRWLQPCRSAVNVVGEGPDQRCWPVLLSRPTLGGARVGVSSLRAALLPRSPGFLVMGADDLSAVDETTAASAVMPFPPR